MNKFTKKLISGITMCSLVFSALNGIVIADNTKNTDNMENMGISEVYINDDPTPTPGATSTPASASRKLYVEFMGRGATPADTSPGQAKLVAKDIGTEFWVGVLVDKINDLSLFTDGIYDLEITFEYNPTYVEPWYPSSSGASTVKPNDAWLSALESGNLGSTNDYAWYDETQYEISSSEYKASTGIDVTTDREALVDAKTNRAVNGWETCQFTITYKADQTFANARLSDLGTYDGKVCLAKIPFRLNSVPDITSPGVDPNPIVLSPVLGPEALDMSSGENGAAHYSEWVSPITDPNDESNMKTLFTFNGDVSLFGGTSAPLEGLTVLEGGVTPTATPRVPDMFQSPPPTQNEKGFNSEVTEYWVSVPSDMESVSLEITTAEAPTVVGNGSSVGVTASGSVSKLWTTSTDIDLDPVDKTVEAQGFNNTVTVTVSGTTYTIHIRRYLKPEIVLNPGNSPYGMIEKMSSKYYTGSGTAWSDDKVQEAKEKLNTAPYRFATGYVPDEALSMRLSNHYISYYPATWGTVDGTGQLVDSVNDIDIDRDSTSIIIFNGRQFRDPGFTITNSMGDLATSPTVNCSISVIRANVNGVAAAVTAETAGVYSDMEYTGITSGYLFTDITSEANAVKRLVPGIYKLNYEWTDPESNEKVTATRNVFATFMCGDANFDKATSQLDFNNIKNVMKIGDHTISGASDKLNRIYLYRILDANNDGGTSQLDLNNVKNAAKDGRDCVQYYPYLPSK